MKPERRKTWPDNGPAVKLGPVSVDALGRIAIKKAATFQDGKENDLLYRLGGNLRTNLGVNCLPRRLLRFQAR